MIETTYHCGRCDKDSTYKFKDGYRPFRAWLTTCVWCRTYTRLVLVNIKGLRMMKWTGVVR